MIQTPSHFRNDMEKHIRPNCILTHSDVPRKKVCKSLDRCVSYRIAIFFKVLRKLTLLRF